MTAITDIKQIAANFIIPGEFISAEPYGCGHINDTYITRFIQSNGTRRAYIIQRINTHIFKDPVGLIANIAAVTTHLREKIAAASGDPARETLTLIPTQTGNYLHISSDGAFWRGYLFIENTRSYQIPENQNLVYHAGKAFGTFQRRLADFPADSLHETIPDFHNTPVRYRTLLAALKTDYCLRAAGAAPEIEFVLQRVKQFSLINTPLLRGDIPLRVTHNDTKFNNLLIDDRTGEAVCIVDLDTVMAGSLLFDFGDAVRSIANTAAEDEPDSALVHFDLKTFDVFTKGYLEALQGAFTPGEFALLPFSARLMTLECGMRFLTDHLNGDTYFRTDKPGHNLDRCRTQFKLVQEMEILFPDMLQIVSRYAPHQGSSQADFIG